MTDYYNVSDADIDSDSVVVQDTMFRIRDNPIAIAEGAAGAPKIQDAALDTGAATTAGRTWVNSRIASASLVQGQLNTSTGEVSESGASIQVVTLPGGQYGFFPQIRGSSSADRFIGIAGGIAYTGAGPSFEAAGDSISTSYGTRLSMSASGGTSYAQQRYINSSPPYNLGDGDVPLFVFVKVDSNGDAIGTYTADVPPWAYNGPTRVTADRIDAATGRKFQRRCFVCPNTGDVVRDEIEITNDVKNADMALIPHPFVGNDLAGKSIILLDPVESLDLLDLHEAGESIAELLYGRQLVIGNEHINRRAPAGVQPCAIKWKNSQQKWRALPSIADRLKK